MRQQIELLGDGRRLHLHDGPIDLIIEAFGESHEIRVAYRAAITRFVTILDELCSELLVLRAQLRPGSSRPVGVIAGRMAEAVSPYAERCFITPMAAVAGAVAEEVLAAMTSAAPLSRTYVNNGGDIALHLAPAEHFTVGMIERPDQPSLFGTATIQYHQTVRGIATSGWRGRSFSLGIADAVTVLAETASQADAAATVIANAVNLPGHPAIIREPARALAPNSDLGDILVTRSVPAMSPPEIGEALLAGARIADELRVANLISSAALALQGYVRTVSSQESMPSIQMHLDRSNFRSPLHA